MDVSRGWNIADIADVKAWVVASQAAELFQDRMAGMKVVIDTDCPSWVVSGEECQVLFYALGMKYLTLSTAQYFTLQYLEILPLLPLGRVRVAIE